MTNENSFNHFLLREFLPRTTAHSNMPKFGDIYVVKAGDEFEGFTGKGQAKAYAKRTEGGTSPTRA